MDWEKSAIEIDFNTKLSKELHKPPFDVNPNLH
jgi:hypothetical protein